MRLMGRARRPRMHRLPRGDEFTPHYRGAHAASRSNTGFRFYVVASRGGGGRSRPHPRIMEEFL